MAVTLPLQVQEETRTEAMRDGERLLEKLEHVPRRLQAILDERPVASVLVTVALGYLVARVLGSRRSF
jgi:hypothetical protein